MFLLFCCCCFFFFFFFFFFFCCCFFFFFFLFVLFLFFVVVVFCAKFPERCGYFELKRNKCDVPVMPMVQCFLVESKVLSFFFFSFFCSFFLQVK